MNLRLKRAPGIYLVGFMGSGKTTIGRLLAARLGWSFADLDEEIEAAERATIAAIFEERGEPEFRRIEAEMLRQHVRSIERGKAAVIALGGGAFAQQQNREIAPATRHRLLAGLPFRDRPAPRRAHFAQAAGEGPGALRRALPGAPRNLRAGGRAHRHRLRRPGDRRGNDRESPDSAMSDPPCAVTRGPSSMRRWPRPTHRARWRLTCAASISPLRKHLCRGGR